MQFIRYVAAATLLLLVGIPSVMYLTAKNVKTSLSPAEIALPDLSTVTLYEHSEMSYKPLLWKFSRKVRLEGKALFGVNKGSRFEVISNKGKTSVLGTEFLIHAQNNDYQVTCLSGKVKVVEFSRQNEAIIIAGQKAILKPDGSFNIVDISSDETQLPGKSITEGLDAELDAVLSDKPAEPDPLNIGNSKSSVDEIPAEKFVREDASEKARPTEQVSVSPGDLPNDMPVKPSDQMPTENSHQAKSENQSDQAETTTEYTSRNRFRNTLSKEQIGILEDPKMSREEKKRAFMESLSSEQRKLLQEQIREQARPAENANTGYGQKDEVRDQQKMQQQEQMRRGSGQESPKQSTQNNGTGNINDPPAENGSGSNKENNSGNGNGN